MADECKQMVSAGYAARAVLAPTPEYLPEKKKRKTGKSPTQRSLEYLRGEGYTVAIVEFWNHFTKRRHDLFQFADLLAIRENEILLVQVTSGSNVSARVKKITENEHIGAVRKSGMRVEIHGWRRLKSGWQPRILDMS